MVPILEPEESVVAVCPLEDAQEKYKESVMQELYTQNVHMLQCSTAVSICKATCEFHTSVERVEAERGLLLSSESISNFIADILFGLLSYKRNFMHPSACYDMAVHEVHFIQIWLTAQNFSLKY
jgi:hypothetical protein